MQKLIEKTHYPQESEYGCIPASIRMVFSAFEKGLGERYTELSLINLLGTSQRGSLLENLMRISKLGFQVEVVSSNLSELLAYLQAEKKPVIVVVYAQYIPYLNSDSLHAVVVVRLDAQNIYFNDPLREEYPMILSHDEFQRAWSVWGNLLIKIERTMN